ncbi:MAG: biotin--[acetyl-CoA-carboxylase] ligase, partial [Alphaproteobacteria bacterium]|nr:biotin--[acetyl-CoA-carboxylase] ligase [Alphaproteobacteria bacterium]
RQLEATASTNEDAKAAALAGEAEGLVIQALRQTSGRGRQGRGWESPEGNFYASVLLRPRCAPREAGFYSFIAALAVSDAVRSFLPRAEIQLKWPNDVLVGGKKISGVLLEASPVDKDAVAWLVIGMGVNVRQHPENGLYPATSLAAEGAGGASVDKVLERLLESLERWREAFLQDGFASIRKAWLEQAKRGPIVARLPHETVEGAFEGLDENGRLILQLADGAKRAIAAGDVFFAS